VKNVIFFFISIVAFLAVPSYSSAQSFWQEQISASDGSDDNFFGSSVSIDGDTCIVGAYGDDSGKGSAYIFTIEDYYLTEQQKLTASDGISWDRFGYSISIDVNECAIGAYGAGAAYIFRYNGSSWVEEQKLVPSGDPRIFGHTIAVDGDVCLVGSPTALVGGVTRGAVYSFRYNGSSWIEEQKLSASDGAFSDQFGDAVSISGDLCLIGMPYHDANGSNTGSAYIFRYNGSSWIEEAKLLPTPPYSSGEIFGIAVSIDANLCIVGADGDDDAANDAGSAYIFRYNGSSWILEQKIFASDPETHDRFADSVCTDGNRCVIGASGDDDNGPASGSAYLFEFNGSSWTQIQKFLADDGETRDYFGDSVSIDSDIVLIGSPDNFKDPAIGSAYIFRPCPTADLDHDCYVDFNDFAILASQWFQAPGEPSADIAPSPIRDGIVDMLDLKGLAEQWLQP
jgi:hypothetical protein